MVLHWKCFLWFVRWLWSSLIHHVFSFIRVQLTILYTWIFEPCHEKACFCHYANNKATDQPAHPRNLISTFVFRCLDSMVPLVSVFKISSLHLASMAAQAGLCLTWLQTPKTAFVVMRLILYTWKKKHSIQSKSHNCSPRMLLFWDQWKKNRFDIHL